MIMSLKAASLGLNMVAACRVLLLDLWWNPTTEDQAIDRAHRIGQTRPVTVLRLTVKDTVEDRILALQVCLTGCNFFIFVMVKFSNLIFGRYYVEVTSAYTSGFPEVFGFLLHIVVTPAC